MKRRYGAWFYIGYVLFWTVVVVVVATVAGALFFPLAAKLFGSDRGLGELALSGARYLAEWSAKVWALSIALVLAFNHAYQHRTPRPADSTEP